MTRYLIDIRLMGPVKQQIRSMTNRLEETFHCANNLVVPHITLAGPFSTGNEKKLVEDFTRVCADQKKIPGYGTGGIGFFDGTRVVYVTIVPDETLKQFRAQLSAAISPYCSLRDYDRDSAEAFRFHATLAMKLDWLTFVRMKWYFRRQERVVYRHHPVRATLMKNAKILCEYDFIQQRMLSRAQALGRATGKRDRDMLRVWEDGGGP